MIKIDWFREDEVVAVRPQGPIDEADFDKVGSVIDPVIARKGRLEGLLIDARGFAGWDDARALLAHLRFVRDHQPKVARIAAVGNQWWLRAVPSVEPVFGTPIRAFAGGEEQAARAWLLESPPEPRGIIILPESTGNMIAVRVQGRLRDADYAGLREELARRFSTSGKLRLLAIIDESFRGWTPKAALDDLGMAFSPWSRRFEKVAVVSGPGLVRWFAEHFPSALIPYDIKAFAPDRLEEARAWLDG